VVVPLADGWEAEFDLARQSGTAVVSQVRVYHRSPNQQWITSRVPDPATLPAGGLPARILRDVRFGEAYRAMREIGDATDARTPEASGPAGLLATLGFEHIGNRNRKRGRPPHDDGFYARVSRQYVEALRTGSRRPVVDVAQELKLSPSRVRSLLTTARKHGLLTPAVRGRAGGAITEKARALLNKGETVTDSHLSQPKRATRINITRNSKRRTGRRV